MAWSISISSEGWNDIYEACHKMDRNELIDAIADDYFEKNYLKGFIHQFNNRFFDYVYTLERYASQEALADLAFDLIQENDTCDNGGFEYWIDQDGYHTVSLP
jgi:hypothetical protein